MISKTDTSSRGVNTNLSYLSLRKLIGYLGLFLPFIVWAMAWKYDSSISHYFYTRAGVVFTSVLTLCGAFLISYRGYAREEEQLSDNVITWIGGILIIIVALVPTMYGDVEDCHCGNIPTCHCSKIWGAIHFGSAVLFFVSMGYLSVFRFTRGDKPFSTKKIRRNKIYLVCGLAMWLILAFAGIMLLFFKEATGVHFIFWVEVALLVFFGISWLVKGKALVDLGLQKEE